ncbi:MFS transporter [Streptomyces violascens]|uniref:MFS transporter n=1 Tax=Streptomyces violascens TaxID=67381 RepID=UPI003647B1B5
MRNASVRRPCCPPSLDRSRSVAGNSCAADFPPAVIHDASAGDPTRANHVTAADFRGAAAVAGALAARGSPDPRPGRARGRAASRRPRGRSPARTPGTPMIDLSLFRRADFLASSAGALFTGLSVIGFFSYLPALLSQWLGTSPMNTAWLFVLWSGTAFAVALQARRLASRVAARHQLAIGFVLHAAGVLAMLGALASGPLLRLLPGLLAAGIGSGLLNAALPRLAVESVPADRAAMGSGANNTARYIGSSAGVALTIAVAPAGPDTVIAVSAGLAVAAAALTMALRPRH